MLHQRDWEMIWQGIKIANRRAATVIVVLGLVAPAAGVIVGFVAH